MVTKETLGFTLVGEKMFCVISITQNRGATVARGSPLQPQRSHTPYLGTESDSAVAECPQLARTGSMSS
ncbi:Alpha-glucosidase 2 [Fusarium oxysporum f. sp. albedinis]|nr:Alpha-glucosidase 2 [Fusarium oxysporum f. sp. albedinis]